MKSKRASSTTDDDSWKEQPVSPTLNAFDNGGDSRATVLAVHGDDALPFTETGFANYGPGVGTLRANGGTLQGGSETLIVAPDPRQKSLMYSDTVGALTVSDLVKGQGNYQSVGNDLLQIQSTEPEVAACLRSGGDGGVPSSRGENLVVQRDRDDIVETFALQPADQVLGKGALRAVRTDVAPTIARGDHHSDRGLRIINDTNPTVLFQQNQRDEVRIMPGYAGSLNAENGMHNTNFVVQDREDDGEQW